jgi:hypothetical protein
MVYVKAETGRSSSRSPQQPAVYSDGASPRVITVHRAQRHAPLALSTRRVCPSLLSYFHFNISPGIATDISLRLPSILFPSSPHHISVYSGLALFASPTSPMSSSRQYGIKMDRDDEPTVVDHGSNNNVYTAPAKPVLPEPELSTPPSYYSESEVEPER